MLQLTKIRDLDLRPARPTAKPWHLSAASGIVCAGPFVYVVADDELHLGVFSLDDTIPGYLVRLFEGKLPLAPADRKRRKPDLEALVALPTFGGYSAGALLALGSGSTRHRCRAALLALDPSGAIAGAPLVIDVAPLLQALEGSLDELNIEGAVVSGSTFCLLNRANRRNPHNVIVRYQLADILDALQSGVAVRALAPAAIDRLDLGEIDGVPLGITDGASLPGGAIAFTAVAEDTADTYNDGRCLGAAIGVIDRTGTLVTLERLDGCPKVEGIAVQAGRDARLLFVTDADDPAIPARLLFASTASLKVTAMD